MRLTFLGAAGEVTGSCLRVDHERGSFLVDCGLFQGGREAERKNREALDFDLRDIDFVLLTHAHLDHSGLVPRLVALGYKGRFFTTAALYEHEREADCRPPSSAQVAAWREAGRRVAAANNARRRCWDRFCISDDAVEGLPSSAVQILEFCRR